MNSHNGRFKELLPLLEAVCEDRLTDEEAVRLEEVVLGDRGAMRFYLEYMDLHGTLHWNTALGGDAVASLPEPLTRPVLPKRRGRRRLLTAAATVTAVLLVVIWLRFGSRRPADIPSPGPTITEATWPTHRAQRAETGRPADRTPRDVPAPDGNVHDGTTLLSPPPVRAPRAVATADGPSRPVPAVRPKRQSSLSEIVAFVNARLENGWDEGDVKPSPTADDAEWIRRVSLDLLGHIPPPADVEAFLRDRTPRDVKRAALVDRLLDDPGYVRNWTTIWTNLLIGRSETQRVNRAALERFLRRSFARNRPWSEMVVDLVAAEGDDQHNGATNFLLAHLNNQAVPATAITSRLFLGVQMQCTQCHNHPFYGAKQSQFWQFNSFFHQTRRVSRRQRDPRTGRMETVSLLVSRPVGGPTYFETRQGVLKAVYPRFAGKSIDPGAQVNRREALARLMVSGEKPLVAQAMVNRMWAHFFGYGFTRPIDDMGPHHPPTHPQLLDRLSREFARGGYDLKPLIRWICRSRAYQLTSRFGRSNQIDNPAIGDAPLFSRMYLKPLTAEQLYDSVLMATRADEIGVSRWDDVVRRREDWLQQFVRAFGTDENDEATSFNGTIPQALMMMNSQLVRKALSPRPGSYFHDVLLRNKNDVQVIRQLAVAALSRYPTPAETTAVRKLLRERIVRAGRNPKQRQQARTEALQDVFWAYLNSAEFLLNH